MGVGSKRIWKENFIFNFFWFLIALIGLWRAHTLWGFLFLASSVGMTTLSAWSVAKSEAGKRDE